MTVRIQSIKNKAWIADQCEVAESFLDRLKGLIGKKTMLSGQGLLLHPCNDIHMWFMSMSIDVVFVKKLSTEKGQNRYLVTSVREHLKPWKLMPVRDWKASATLELPPGTIRKCDICSGDELCIN
jgi:uncharacterized membrane protein (UPF0127 family)